MIWSASFLPVLIRAIFSGAFRSGQVRVFFSGAFRSESGLVSLFAHILSKRKYRNIPPTLEHSCILPQAGIHEYIIPSALVFPPQRWEWQSILEEKHRIKTE